MTAFQDKLVGNHCYGCGVDNDKGMQIKSRWQGDEFVCHYMPRPEQCAGPEHFVYGGTIASLVDCHCNGMAMSNYYKLEGREVGEGPEIWCVTGRLTVSYLEPTPIDQEIVLRSTIEEAGERKTIVNCRVYSGDTKTADGEVVSIRVPSSWRDAP